MKHFSRLVCNAGSITVLIGSTALMPATFAAQLLGVVPDSSALIVHSSQGYLGVEMRDIDNDRAAALKLKEPAGAEITIVDHDAPAGKVGLRVHDVILQMNGQLIQGVEQLRRMLHETPAGRNIVLVISRDGQQQTINVQLADRATIEQDAWLQHRVVPEPDDDSTFALVGPSSHGGGGSSFFGAFAIGTPTVGVDVDPLGSQLADYFGVKDGQGLLVKHVAENSPASTAGFKAGDVITKVNGESMPTLNTWFKTLHANRGKQMQVTIVRNHKEQTLSLQAGDPKHKGELVWPGVDIGPGIHILTPDDADPDIKLRILRPEINPGFAQLEMQIDPELLAQQARQTINSIDAAALADQARQTIRSLDLPELQLQMRDLQMPNLDENLQLLHLPGYSDMD
jgi:serine protease Do